MAAATPEEVKKWKEYDYGHLKVIRELGIDQTKLPTDIKQRARGVILALGKINTDEGFRKLVTQSAAIGDDIITWHEREAKEEEAPAASGTAATPAADKGNGGSDNGGGAGDADKKGADGLTDAERKVLEQHGGGGSAGGSGGSGGSQNQQQEEDGDVTFFGW